MDWLSLCAVEVIRQCVLHWPTAHLLFHFWVHILIENFLLNKEITLFLVWEPLFTRNLTFYVLANLNLIYWPTYSMYLFLYVAFSFFRSTINEEHCKINILTFSGEICQQHQENVYFLAHSTKNSATYKMFSER